MKKKIVVTGGGENLYKIGQSGSKFYAMKKTPYLLGYKTIEIGSASSFDDALSLIKSYSGKSIKKIENW